MLFTTSIVSLIILSISEKARGKGFKPTELLFEFLEESTAVVLTVVVEFEFLTLFEFVFESPDRGDLVVVDLLLVDFAFGFLLDFFLPEEFFLELGRFVVTRGELFAVVVVTAGAGVLVVVVLVVVVVVVVVVVGVAAVVELNKDSVLEAERTETEEFAGIFSVVTELFKEILNKFSTERTVGISCK